MLEQLKKKREEYQELSDLPIEDFVDWDGFIRIVDNSIQVIEKYEKALKRISRNLEEACGTVDKPKRPTLDDVYEVYLITRESLK